MSQHSGRRSPIEISARPLSRGARRRAYSRRLQGLMLFSFCASLFTTGAPAVADPRPLIPPLPCCNNYGVNPMGAAACIGTPYIPVCEVENMGAPAGAPWNLTIQEAVNVALSNSEAVRNLGLVEAGSRNDIVRSVITRYDPMQARSEAQAQWGIFDPLLTTYMNWDKQDIPPGTSFNGIGNRPPQLDQAEFDASIEQLLPIGTRVRYDYVTDYLFNPQHPPGLLINPQYFSYDQFTVTQPLLRGFGVDVTMAPIKIAAAQAEQTDWQFKQEILALIRSIETTYWALYAQHQNLKAIDAVLPHFREVVRLQEQQAGTVVGIESQLGRARSDMYLYEQRRLETLSKIAENQLVLRNLMGVPPSDCRDVVPLAIPATTKPFETLQQAVDEAVSQRPDVLRQRLQVYVAQQERLLADNATRPQLDFQGFYRMNGLDNTLDGSWNSKASNNFDSWHMGVFFQVPLGRRQSINGLRAAEYALSRERAMLNQTAHQASYEVADAYRRLHWVYQQLEVVASRQQALQQWAVGARAQFENPPQGMTPIFALDRYLQNLRDATDSTISKNSLLADYNSAIARLQEVKGVLLENRRVTVAGDVSDKLPKDLPRPDLALPESVQPVPQTPLQPAPQVIPPPSSELPQPAPQPQPGQPAPIGQPANQGARVAPQIEQPQAIMSAPADQPRPLPQISLPESVSVTPAPIVPAPPQVSAVQQAPMAQPKWADIPEVQRPATEVARQLPPATMQSPSIMSPRIQLPESIKHAPPTNQSAPSQTLMPDTALDAPIVELPMIESQPFGQAPSSVEPTPWKPMGPSPMLVLPESVAPAPAATKVADRTESAPAPASRDMAVTVPAPMMQPTPEAVLRMPPSLSSSRGHTIIKHSPEAPAAEQPAPERGQPVEIARRESQPMSHPSPSTTLQLPGSVRPQTPSAPTSMSPTAPADGSLAPVDDGDYAAGPVLQPAASGNMTPASSLRQSAPNLALQAPLNLPDSIQPSSRQPLFQPPQYQTPRYAPPAMNSEGAARAQASGPKGFTQPRVAQSRTIPMKSVQVRQPASDQLGPELRMPNSVETIIR
jgi:outer membrane protein TolC